jgi:acyl-CoA hydrolase
MDKNGYKQIAPHEAIELITDNSTVAVSHASGEARHFYQLIHTRATQLRGVNIYGANPTQLYPCFQEKDLSAHINFDLMFLNKSVRQTKNIPHVQYVPSHMSRWSRHICSSAARKKNLSPDQNESSLLDIFWGSCSPPNEDGFVSLGLNAVYEAELIHKARIVILEMNPLMPFTFGATLFPSNKIDFVIPQDAPPPSHDAATPEAEDLKIGEYVAELVNNGSTIQLGIGAIPNAIGQSLSSHKHLGVHTEMINDAIMNLTKQGVIDGSAKTIWGGKIIGAFAYGTRDLYQFMHKNPKIELHPASLINDRASIAKNYKMTSINTAIEIDLTGQVCSESIGHGEISGTGGASDTHVSAQFSPGGRGIIALRSTTRDQRRSKIVPSLADGAKVSIHRNDVDTIVTEYGIAELSGKNTSERVRSLIAIAHPKFRDELFFTAKKFGYCS